MNQAAAVAPGMSPDMSLVNTVTLEDVEQAADRIAGVAKRTPIVTNGAIDELTGAQVFLKCENLQRVGAFKFRGACNGMRRLKAKGDLGGVLAYSSGNHAQAVALSAAMLNVPAVIIMPENAPRVKLAATRAYLENAPAGSEVITYDPATMSREELGSAIAAERDLTIVPPYDNPSVIAGQGTAALELWEDVGSLDMLFVCCGGGGLLSGSATVAKGMSAVCRVIGVEPELADDATRSFETRTLQTVKNPPTIADGARTPYLGRHTFPIVLDRVDRMMTVPDASIARWVLFGLERLRMVFEPTGVLGLAGLARLAAEEPEAVRGKRVGVIISGGNLDLDMIPRLREIAAGS